jgi:hypothetical protein
MYRKLFWAAALSAAALSAPAQASTIVFSDNFDDGDVSDWTFSTNYAAGVAGTDLDGVMGPYIDAPPGGNDLYARRSITLDLLAGDYTLDLDAYAVVCSGCTISYDVIFDGESLTRAAGTNAFEGRSFNLGALSAGSYTLTLGMHTTNASSGHFLAKFDNVVLRGDNLVGGGVPEPATWGLMILGFAGAGAAIRRRRAALA